MKKDLYCIEQSTKTLTKWWDVTAHIARYVLDLEGFFGDIVGFSQRNDARAVLAYYLAGRPRTIDGNMCLDDVRSNAPVFASAYSRGRAIVGTTYYRIKKKPFDKVVGFERTDISVCFRRGIVRECNIEYDECDKDCDVLD